MKGGGDKLKAATMTATPNDRLFVYGTLQTCAAHPMGDLLRDKARLIGTGAINARLYYISDPEDETNKYPGALPSPDPSDRVFGELYEVLDAEGLYPALDRFEACGPDYAVPNEFIAREVDVMLDDGTTARAICYLYSWDVSDAVRLRDGRFDMITPDVW